MLEIIIFLFIPCFFRFGEEEPTQQPIPTPPLPPSTSGGQKQEGKKDTEKEEKKNTLTGILKLLSLSLFLPFVYINHQDLVEGLLHLRICSFIEELNRKKVGAATEFNKTYQTRKNGKMKTKKTVKSPNSLLMKFFKLFEEKMRFSLISFHFVFISFIFNDCLLFFFFFFFRHTRKREENGRNEQMLFRLRFSFHFLLVHILYRSSFSISFSLLFKKKKKKKDHQPLSITIDKNESLSALKVFFLSVCSLLFFCERIFFRRKLSNRPQVLLFFLHLFLTSVQDLDLSIRLF